MSRGRAKRAWATLRAGEPYEQGRKGWMVSVTGPASETRGAVTTYWYGPEHGDGTMTGPLCSCARVWPSKRDTELALREVYGSPSTWRGARPEPVSTVEERERSRHLATT